MSATNFRLIISRILLRAIQQDAVKIELTAKGSGIYTALYYNKHDEQFLSVQQNWLMRENLILFLISEAGLSPDDNIRQGEQLGKYVLKGAFRGRDKVTAIFDLQLLPGSYGIEDVTFTVASIE